MTIRSSKFHILLVLFSLFAGVPIAAQSPPPPRPVGRFGDPVRAQASFESKEGGFKIAFPNRPTQNSQESETSFGKTKLFTYSAATSLATYVVVHLDFPTAIKDKFDLDTRFDAMRDNQIKRDNGRVISETELYFGAHYGRDLVYEASRATNWMRAIMVEQRLFLLTVQTPGNHVRQSQGLKAATESRVKKFFDSFVVTEIPKPRLTAVQLPADFGVSLTGSTFLSTFFDLSFEIPKDWIVLKSSETEQLIELGKEDLAKSRPNLAKYMMDSQNARILLVATKSALETSVNTAVLVVGAEKVTYPNFLPMSAAETFATSFLDPTEKIVKAPVLEIIGGIEFAWLETFDSTAKKSRRIYFANRKGIAFEFSLTYQNVSDLNVMLRSIQSLKAK